MGILRKVEVSYPHNCLRGTGTVVWTSGPGNEYHCECEISTPYLKNIINYLEETAREGDWRDENLAEMEDILARRETYFDSIKGEGVPFSWEELIGG